MTKWIYLWTLTAIGACVVAGAIVTVMTSAIDLTALVLTVLAAASGFSVLRLRSISASFSLSDAFTLSALFLYGPELATLTVAVDTVAMSFRLGGAPHRALFNTAAPSLAMWLAGSLVFRVAGLPLPAVAPDFLSLIAGPSLAVALFFVIDSGLVAAAVALHNGRPMAAVWRQLFAKLWVGPAVGGYLGLLLAIFTREMGMLAILALLPVPAIVYQLFRNSLARADDQLRHLEQMNQTYASTIEAFATAVDAKDQVTHGHLRRVQAYSLALAEQLGLTDTAVLRSLEAATLLHDVGKIGIPEHILNKPGKLTPAEFETMKRHVTIGADILSAVEFPFPVVPIVRHHHENWDGTGYPDGLSGTDIPLGARILMVVDCFDALTSDRPYRPALSVEAAFDILRERRGRMYDPQIVDLFIEIQPGLARSLGFDAPEPQPVLHQALRLAEAWHRPPAPEAAPAGPIEPIARLLGDLLGDSLSVIYEPDSTCASIVAKAAKGPGARSVIGHRQVVGQGVSGWVAANHRGIDDTDAVLDLAGVLPPAELTSLSCTSMPVTSGGMALVVTVYGPRTDAARRLAVVRGVTQYLATLASTGTAGTATTMAKAS